jgi:hypothetical protein
MNHEHEQEVLETRRKKLVTKRKSIMTNDEIFKELIKFFD